MLKTIVSLDGQRRRLDPRYVDFIWKADRVLSARTDYVGVAPYGSQFKGCAVESSDFDVILIAGDGRISTETQLNDQVKEVAYGCGVEAHTFQCWNADFFESNLRVTDPKELNLYSNALWPLAYPFIGKTAELRRFRKLMREKHRQVKGVDPDYARYNLTDAVFYLVHWELGVNVSFVGDTIIRSSISRYDATAEKILSRGYSRNQLRDIAVTRAHMWLKHISMLVHN